MENFGSALTNPTPSSALRLTQYAAGNVFDKHPVTLIDTSAFVDGRTLSARVPAAWVAACSLLTVSPADKKIPCVDLAQDIAAAMVIAEFARALRQLCGLDQGKLIYFRNVRGDHLAGVAAPEKAAGTAALRAAASLLLQPAVSRATHSDLAALRYEASLRLGTRASAVATRLDIPWRIAASAPNPFVVLGQGCRRRLFWLHIPGASGYIGSKLVDDKRLSSEVLRRAGLPAPPQREVRDVKEAHAAAQAIGWPVVVKPAVGFGGKGVTAGILDIDTLSDAFAMAKPNGPVVVEKHIEGHHHRIVVIRGQCVSALLFDAAHVLGDGRKTISELLAATNATRTEGLSRAWKKIELDDNALAMLRRQGFCLDDVPIAGERVALRSQSNLSSGGTFTDVTDSLHPDTQRLAETAARLFDLEICGVDFITPDASRSWLEVGGGINEVNKNPSFLLGDDETAWADTIIGGWFPEPARGRIPVVVLLDGRPASGAFDFPKALASMMHDDVSRVALASTLSVRFGAVLSKGPGFLPHQVEAALADPVAEALVISASPDEIVQDGLGLDRCDVIVVASGLTAEDARAVSALARLAQKVVMPPDSPAVFTTAVPGKRICLAESASDADLVAAVAAVMRSVPSPCCQP